MEWRPWRNKRMVMFIRVWFYYGISQWIGWVSVASVRYREIKVTDHLKVSFDFVGCFSSAYD